MDYEWIVRKVKVPFSGRNNVEIAQTYVLRYHGLPAGYNYRIHVETNGNIFSRSCPGSCGGVRYYQWGNESDPKRLWAALDHGMKWARHHQRIQRRAASDEPPAWQTSD